VLSLDAESASPAAPPDYLTILTNPAGSSFNADPSPASSSSPESIENLVLNAEPPDRTPGVELELELEAGQAEECARNNTSVI